MKYLKALYASALTGLGSASTALAVDNGHIGWQAGVTIAIATLTSFGVVWGVPNGVTASSGSASE
jgi:hypothetical protein